jgi:hypothetical protein
MIVASILLWVQVFSSAPALFRIAIGNKRICEALSVPDLHTHSALVGCFWEVASLCRYSGFAYGQFDGTRMHQSDCVFHTRSSIWLEEYLANYPKTLLLVSHNQTLLDRVCNNIIRCANKRLTTYTVCGDRLPTAVGLRGWLGVRSALGMRGICILRHLIVRCPVYIVKHSTFYTLRRLIFRSWQL